MIVDNSLKTRVISSNLAALDSVRWTLHAERKNMSVSVRNNDLFPQKCRFSRNAPTENDILGMIDDNCLKTLVIPSKLASFDRVRWTLQAEYKNMFVSVRNNDLFSMKRRFSRFSITEHDILEVSDDNSWKLVLFVQNFTHSIEFVGFYKQNTRTSMFLWGIMIYSRTNVDFRAFRQRTRYFGYYWR